MLAKFSGVESKRTVFKFRYRKKYIVVFTDYIKQAREIRKFHVAVVQRRLRTVEKSVIHEQSCCFANVMFSLPSPSSLLKLLIVVVQKYCYHGNVTSNFSSQGLKI